MTSSFSCPRDRATKPIIHPESSRYPRTLGVHGGPCHPTCHGCAPENQFSPFECAARRSLILRLRRAAAEPLHQLHALDLGVGKGADGGMIVLVPAAPARAKSPVEPSRQTSLRPQNEPSAPQNVAKKSLCRSSRTQRGKIAVSRPREGSCPSNGPRSTGNLERRCSPARRTSSPWMWHR